MTAPTIKATPRHVAALAEIKAKTDRIRYAVEHAPHLSVPDLLTWLSVHDANPAPQDKGTPIRRSHAAGIVKSYREGRRVTDTGDLPQLTPALLAELDAVTPDRITGDPVQTEIHPVQTEIHPVQTEIHPVQTDDVTPVFIEPPTPANSITTESTPADVEPVPPTPAQHDATPHGAGLFYVVAVASTLVSIDTSWRFFGEILHITRPIERGAMFAVLELALIACGYAMRANVRRPNGTPGAARMLAWVLCGMSAYMAVALSGPVEGFARVALGPVLALVALHLALGIEVRVRSGQNTGTGARVLRELRERVLSRLGLGDDSRTALARTRDRAADRAARLATARRTPFRARRLARAVHASGATIDPAQRARVMTQVAALRHLDDLVNADRPSPWLH